MSFFTGEQTIFFVDDDAALREANVQTLDLAGLAVEAFPDAQSVLPRIETGFSGIVVTDIRMPGMDGLALQQLFGERGQAPVMIFVSGDADVSSCAQAMRAGAVDFLTKPVDAAVLLEAVMRGIDADACARIRRSGEQGAVQRYQCLTPRERQVLPPVSSGRLNKQIAADLGISLKTTKVHRSRIMVKFGVRSVAALVRLAELAHVDPGGG